MASNQNGSVIGGDSKERAATLLAALVEAGWMECRDPSEVAALALNALRRAAEREQWSHGEWITVMWAADLGARR